VSILSMAALALALSVDGLAVGLAYGIRRIEVSRYMLALIAVCTFLLMGISIQLGGLAAELFSPLLARRLGGGVLVGVGLWQLAQGLLERAGARGDSPDPRVLVRLRIRSLGLVVQILRDPCGADLDGSGSIDGGESILLGVVLGLDAVGAGFGAAMTGCSYWLAPVAALSLLVGGSDEAGVM